MTDPRMDISWPAYARQIGLNLHQARMEKGLSQERVAHLAGVAGYTYQKFEKGESRPGTPMNPQLRTLLALSHVLDLPLDRLLPPTMPPLEDLQ